MQLLSLLALAEAKKPHILHVLLDDYGWANAGWHRPAGYADVQTPKMDALVEEGIELDRFYVYKFCSPSRSAVQTGRNPIHVNVLNLDPSTHNAEDLVSGYAAIPKDMTGMAEHMLRGGYETHMYGKWDAGMATPQHTPHGRGYQKTLSYFSHANDYWTSQAGACQVNANHSQGIVDLWWVDEPAHGLNNTPSCSQDNQHDGCIYEDELFANRVIAAIEERPEDQPLFIFWSPHIVHVPLQVPNAELDKFSFINDTYRQTYNAMTYWVDEAIGRVAQKLKDEGIWDDTLVVVHADNGGPVYGNGGHDGAANNYPLKGGKMSNWDGGIRVNAFVTGGFVPEARRGSKSTDLITGWDWYATFAGLAGVDPTDHKAAAAGLPPHDSYDVWPALSGAAGWSPRVELPLGDMTDGGPSDPWAKTTVGGLIWPVGEKWYKLLVGNQSMSVWFGREFPNTTSWGTEASFEIVTCGRTAETGCLYEILADPGEHENLAPQHPELFAEMLARADELAKTAFSPDRGSPSNLACQAALQNYKGFWGPFIGLPDGRQAAGSGMKNVVV